MHNAKSPVGNIINMLDEYMQLAASCMLDLIKLSLLLNNLQHYAAHMSTTVQHRVCCLQAVIPRSAQPGRIWNKIALDFELSAVAIQSIDEMANTLA